MCVCMLMILASGIWGIWPMTMPIAPRQAAWFVNLTTPGGNKVYPRLPKHCALLGSGARTQQTGLYLFSESGHTSGVKDKPKSRLLDLGELYIGGESLLVSTTWGPTAVSSGVIVVGGKVALRRRRMNIIWNFERGLTPCYRAGVRRARNSVGMTPENRCGEDRNVCT